MNHTEQRKRLRAVFAASKCVSPASVYDGLAARVAEGDRASQKMFSEIERGLALIDQPFA